MATASCGKHEQVRGFAFTTSQIGFRCVDEGNSMKYLRRGTPKQMCQSCNGTCQIGRGEKRSTRRTKTKDHFRSSNHQFNSSIYLHTNPYTSFHQRKVQSKRQRRRKQRTGSKITTKDPSPAHRYHSQTSRSWRVCGMLTVGLQ